ncbi:RNA-binding protein 48-like [Argopecten irradians]|uniref:RNA-binding protein 48-like n=1 Tax=Argopecten irradians TaxID=31199 RepID=UPI00371AB177
MAAPMNVPLHHVRGETCSTRPVYREGRNPKAVKVYTVNLESRYLLIQGVPAVGATQELIKLCALYGAISEYRFLDEYPTADKFTDVYLIKYERIQSARIARRKLDDWSFYGGILHVCYAPEYESVEETRLKLQDRRKAVAARIRRNEAESGKPSMDNYATSVQSQSCLSGSSFQVQSSNSKSKYGQSQSHISGQGSNGQDNRSNQRSSNSQFTKSGQGSKLSETVVPIDKTIPTETQADRTLQVDSRVPPYHKGILPMEEEQQLWIPPPPKQMTDRKHLHGSASDYEFARVRTAHSVYPAKYDARIFNDETKHYSSDYIQQSNKRNPNVISDHVPNDNNDFKEMVQQGKISTGDSADIDKERKGNNTKCDSYQKKPEVKTQAGVIVRTFKPQTAPPKFVPRQMMNLSKKTVHNKVNTQKDEMNEELRRNALKLGEVHGPVAKGQDSVQEPVKPTETEESVEKSRSQIRKRVHQITSTDESKAKRGKHS